MSKVKITIYINDEPVFDFDRNPFLEEEQIKFLDKMDSDMDRGLKIDGQLIEKPEMQHRTKFVAMNLLRALRQEEHAKVAALTAYLTQRRPALIEIRANDVDNAVVIDLVDE